MSKLSVKDRVTAMTRDVLGPEMKVAGFRRSGRVFWRDGPDVCHVVSVEMNRWGSSDANSFGVALGVFWHRVEAILENPSAGKMPPPEYRCTFRIDLGRVISMPPKREWRVTHRSNYDVIGAEVWRDLRDYGFAWLKYRSDLKRTLEWKRYATPEGDGTYSVQELVLPKAQVVFKVMLGKKASAVADLQCFAKNGYADDASRLARKLCLSTRGKLPVDRKPARRRLGR
jgi:hypothetical protein